MRMNLKLRYLQRKIKENGVKEMLETGMTGQGETIVTMDNTAKAMGSGDLQVFATPAMIALMEQTAYQSVAEELEEGMTTVGTYVSVKHMAPTPVGMKVTCRTELMKADGKALTFHVEAFDDNGLIGDGTHERYIVGKEKFQKKADSKKA